MLGTPKRQTDSVKILNKIERVVHNFLKPYGFTKHGRTLHRFVSEDISQVINFQLGQAYLGATHLLFVNIGIRVPECMIYSFEPDETKQKYYHEYDCNIRSRLGTVEGKQESCYNLCTSTEAILEDILRQIQDIVLPAFEILNSREMILEKRRDYPEFDQLNAHLILREEAMIYKHLGNSEKAEQLYNAYVNMLIERANTSDTTIITRQGWLSYALELAEYLMIPVAMENQNRIKEFLKMTV